MRVGCRGHRCYPWLSRVGGSVRPGGAAGIVISPPTPYLAREQQNAGRGDFSLMWIAFKFPARQGSADASP